MMLCFNGAVALIAFVWAVVQSIQVHNQYPRQWLRVLFYCVLVLAALIISNTNWVRLSVLIALILYARVSEHMTRGAS